MRTSISTTSGIRSCAFSTASWPSDASPTSSRSSSLPSTISSPRRNSAWSSTTITRSRSLSPLLVTRRVLPVSPISLGLGRRGCARILRHPSSGTTASCRDDRGAGARACPAPGRSPSGHPQPRRALGTSFEGSEAPPRPASAPSSFGWCSLISSRSSFVARGSIRPSGVSFCSAMERTSLGHLHAPPGERHVHLGDALLVFDGSSAMGSRPADLVFSPTLACGGVRTAAWTSTAPALPPSPGHPGQDLLLNRAMLSHQRWPYVGRFARGWHRLPGIVPGQPQTRT